ncbi:MAG TPA: hypothetical protein VF403_20640 [Kofleriaceae bacterium]
MSLGPTSRNLVAAARSGLDPAPEVAARVRAKVALAVGGAASVASTSAGRASVASGKLVALIVAGAVIVTTWLVVHSASPPALPPAISTPMVTGDEPQVEPHFTSSVHAEAAPLAAPTAAKVATVPLIETPVAVPPAAPVAPPVTPATLAREVALLDAAMTSLHENDPADTLATLVIYDRETLGHGQLAEDAAALEIEARCRTNQPVADKLATFDQRWPRSVQRARITERCSDATRP